MARKLATDWTKHIKDAKAKEDFEVAIRNSTVLVSRLDLIAKDKISQNASASISGNKYDSPSWAYVQADGNGYRRAWQEVRELLSFTGDSDT